jgi:hypothetical protein
MSNILNQDNMNLFLHGATPIYKEILKLIVHFDIFRIHGNNKTRLMEVVPS